MTAPFPTIRAYRPEDIDSLVRLWTDCRLTTAYNDPRKDVERWLATPETAAILVCDGSDGVIGSVVACHDGHRGWLYYLAVDPTLRQRGVGRRLVRAAEQWLAQRGIPKVQLMVRPTNAAVAAFYYAIGYGSTPRLTLARWLDPESARLAGQPIKPAESGGTLDIVITYLEMTERPRPAPIAPPTGAVSALLRARRPSVDFYRFLYNGVGGPWLWWLRRAMSDAEIAEIVGDERVEVYVLYVDGVPAGYYEIDRRKADEVDLAYFGLMPDFVGRGFGLYMLQAAVESAWSSGPSRVTVNTCTLDHPRALPLYQRAGFSPYRREERVIVDPRSIGLIPPDTKVTGAHEI